MSKTIGIYLITNTVNGKCYVGQSVDISKRLTNHKTSKKKYIINNAFRKYGIENFTFEVLLECQEENLDFFEKSMIIGYNSIAPYGYNLTEGGEGGRRSEETRMKMSNAAKCRPSNRLGKHVSEESKQKMSEAKKKMSKETKRKMSEARIRYLETTHLNEGK